MCVSRIFVCTRTNVATIHANKILTKHFKFTVYMYISNNHRYIKLQIINKNGVSGLITLILVFFSKYCDCFKKYFLLLFKQI